MKICLPHGSKASSSINLAARVAQHHAQLQILAPFIFKHSIHVFTTTDLTFNSCSKGCFQSYSAILCSTIVIVCAAVVLKGWTIIVHAFPAIKECAHIQHVQTLQTKGNHSAHLKAA